MAGAGSVHNGNNHNAGHSSRLPKSPAVTLTRSSKSSSVVAASRLLMSQAEAAADSAAEMLEFAEAILSEAHRFTLPHTGAPVRVRVGVHTGRVTSGVVGQTRRKFTILGSTVR